MRAMILVLVGSVLLGMAGCQGTTEDDDSKSRASRCEDLCATFIDCEGASFDVNRCEDACVSDARAASDTCVSLYEDVADCVDDVNLDCDSANVQCTNEVENWVDVCENDFQNTFEAIVGSGGTCSDSCVFSYDGYCDEPDLCAPGTDSYDCGC